MTGTSLISRYIHFYDLFVNYYRDQSSQNENNASLIAVFNRIIEANEKNYAYRRLTDKQGELFMVDVRFIAPDKKILGKLVRVRRDALPEIMDVSNGTLRDILAAEEEGIAESTHFMVDYRRQQPRVIIEYNHHGPRITDFIRFFKRVGKSGHIVKGCNFEWVLQDDKLASYERRMNRCARFTANIHKDNIGRVNAMDSNLYTALNTASTFSEAEHVELTFKFDYKERQETNKIKQTVSNIIRFFRSHTAAAEDFEKLQIEAEDGERNNRLEVFDLLIQKERSEINVERREKSRTLVSADLFNKMRAEYADKFERGL